MFPQQSRQKTKPTVALKFCACSTLIVKVAHLSTSMLGGAGMAAKRSHLALVAAKVDSTIYTLSHSESEQLVANNIQVLDRTGTQRLASGALTRFQREFIQKGPHLVTPLSVGLPLGNLDLNRFDIVHIHSMYNLINYKTLEEILSKGSSIVISMHDQRLTTGGCHGSMGCINFASNCQLCPQVRRIFEPIVQNSALKLREVVNRYRDQIVLVSPSRWLAEIAKSVFPNVRVQHLFNCVDVDFSFEEFARKNHKPLKNGIKIGFSSVDLNNSYKGLNVLLEALRFLPTNKLEKYELALFGTGSVENLPSNLRIRQFGLIEGRELQKEFLNLDALVVPSVQDNSPNVVIEAISLGIPVIGSDAGGIPELLQHFALPIFPNRNSKELSVILEAIPRLLEKKLDLMKARELFSPAAHGESLLQIYRNI